MMLSVIIETVNEDEALAHTLASLVGGAVEGVVREVIVCGSQPHEPTRVVCDQAGCDYLAGLQASAAASHARSDWLLILEPGSRLLEGWMDAVLAHVQHADSPARFTPLRHSWTRSFFSLLKGRRPLASGLMITRRQVLELSSMAASAEAIAKAVSASRIKGAIAVAPRKQAWSHNG